MSRVELTIRSSYVSRWGLKEGVRELIQNALDQEAIDKSNTMSIKYENETLFIANKNSYLTRDTLLFGTTTKEGLQNTIGQFGEGYKLAMLCLTRQGYKVTIFNKALNEVWKPILINKRSMNNAEILAIDICKESLFNFNKENNLLITVEGITVDEFKDLQNDNLILADYYKNAAINKDYYANEYGKVLIQSNYKGKIFVSGLYVTTINTLVYGYDFRPGLLKLNRDRDMIAGFDVQWETGKVVTSLPDYMLSGLIMRGSADTEYLQLTLEQRLKESSIKQTARNIWKDVKSQYGLAMPCATETEANIYRAMNIPAAVINSQVTGLFKEMSLLDEIKDEVSKDTRENEGNFKSLGKEILSYLLKNAEVISTRVASDLADIINKWEK